MLAGVSYKKEYDKVIPKAETNKEIKQPPNIGIRRRKQTNPPKPPQPKPRQPPKPLQPPGSLTRNIAAEGYEMDENKALALSEEERFYSIQYNKRKDHEGGPSETYILKVILFNFYNDKNPAHQTLKKNMEKKHMTPPPVK